MSKREEVKRRIEKLRKLINYHRYLYHVLNRQEISDDALDSLKKELFDLEQQYPEFITPDSPTQRVAGKPLKGFKKVKHPFPPMLSLFDAFSEKDMKDWQERYEKVIGPNNDWGEFRYYCELKLDGLAIELIYRNGILSVASTRGDGKIGEEVTLNVKTIEAIPLRILEKEIALRNLKKEGLFKTLEILEKEYPPKELIVRGEVFMNKKEFARLNKEFAKKGERTYANPRNLAAGSLRQLDPRVTASRKLDSYAYELITDLGQETHEEKHRILKCLGFKTNPHNRLVKDLQGVFDFHSYWQKHRQQLSYEIDGIVVILNNNKLFEKAGVVGKGPRAAIAYKFSPKEAVTTIKDIVLQIGRTNVLTPVAIFEPVKVGGVLISRATLHNLDEIRRLGLKIGDTVIVSRAGDVIPQVVKVLKELRTGKEKDFQMPKKCPFCGAKVKREGAFYKCTNPNCFAAQRERMYHFISPGAFDMKGLGPKVIDRFLEEGLIEDVADLFLLEEGDIESLFRFGKKSAENIIRVIRSHKNISLPQFIYALGIPLVGEETSQDLAEFLIENSQKKIKTISDFLEVIKSFQEEDFEKIKDVGPKVAKSIYQFFTNKKNINFIKKLEKIGIILIVESEKKTKPLKGLNFVFTGSLEKLSREEAKKIVRELGGDVSSTVSKNVNYVVVGKEPGSKYEKAKKLGLKIINEREFLNLTSL